MPYQKAGHSSTWWITVTDAQNRVHRLSTGVHDKETAIDMEIMLRALSRRGARNWDVIRGLLEKDESDPRRRRLTLEQLYDFYHGEALDELREGLEDRELQPLIVKWLRQVEREHEAETLRAYRRHIKALAGVDDDGEPLPLMRTQLTSAWIAERRDAVPGGIPSVRAHLTAWSSCCRFLVERGVLDDNPCSRIRWPKAPKTKSEAHIDNFADVRRFVAAFPTLETRAIAALREDVGADWDALGRMRRRHIIDVRSRLVSLPGDKNDNRDREVQLQPWAFSHLMAYVRATPRAPGAPMFDISQRMYNDRHRDTVAAVREKGVDIPDGYTPHCSRHTFAVRKRREGWPDWKIASYLGNTAHEVAFTYGKFTPTRHDMQHDEGARRRGKRGR